MLDITLLKELLIIAIALSVITLAFIQKTKGIFKKSKWINPYSLVVNMIFGILFCLTFTESGFINSLWVGLFSYLGADTLYKTLEGKLASFKDIVEKKVEIIERKDVNVDSNS